MHGASETPEKRLRVESADPCTPQPLTKENLALLDGTMPPKSKTEDGGTSSSKPPMAKSSTADHGKQTDILHYNGMNIDSILAIKSKIGMDIMNAAQDLVTSSRDSAMSERTVDNFLENRMDREFSNEDTFVDVMWRILVDDSRKVQQHSSDELECQQEWLTVRWNDSGLRHNRNQQFLKGSVPYKDSSGQKALDQWLRKLPDVLNPKPDLIYGLHKKAFGQHEGLVNLGLEGISNFSKDILYPFFVIEFKSGSADFQAARIQACRDGAAIIHSMRKLREKAELANNNNENDEGRLAFSMAMNVVAADIYVHWAHKKKSGEVVYEMALMEGFDIRKGEQLPKLRSYIDNILDWGLLKRKFYIKELLAKIDPRCKESTGGEGEDDDEDEEDDDDNDGGEVGEEEDDEDGSEDELSRA